ncbi:hypothetical protein PN398_14605 [Romboutsia sp. 1001216sp1]|uniref:phage head completion protein n=1 Tax=Romboutsia sp. 1001216sp1 TaxID=2986997 RepID=UPI00232B2743|nr:hypothetical protein [Romboutsia sp. 1001216sp1]MDB8791950.1 hypothetical protein [Romboutsia sp. 1001216sp1]
MFYTSRIDIYKETFNKNEIGQSIKSYEFLKNIKCDIQPSTVNIIRKTFGEDIESLFTVFSNEDMSVGTVVRFNNNTYRINKKIDWIDYKVYSIIGCDVNVG